MEILQFISLWSNMDLCYNAATPASAESKTITGVGTLTETVLKKLYQRTSANYKQ